MQSSSKRPTLREVAQLASVSPMTASRVVNGLGVVGAARVARVRAAIEKLGYKPDPALSALAEYRTGIRSTKGSVLAFLDSDGTAYSDAVYEGLRAEVNLLGYQTERFSLPRDPAKIRRLGQIISHRGIQGVLIGPSAEPREFGNWDWTGMAAVALDALEHHPPVNTVAMDYFHSAFSAAEYLKANGCRRVGLLVQASLQARTGERWMGGYLAWARRNQAEPFCAPDNIDLRKGVSRWLKKSGVDGVATIHPEVSTECRRLDVMTTSLNRTGAERGQMYYDLDPGMLGREAIRILHHSLLRREFGLPLHPKHVALRGVLRVDGD